MSLDLRFYEAFNRPVQDVWRMISEQHLLARWLMANDIVPALGHRFSLRDPPTPDWNGEVACEIVEIAAPHRMVWAWRSGPGAASATRVFFELSPTDSGTRLAFRHAGDEPATGSDPAQLDWGRKLGYLRNALGQDYACRVAFNAPRTRVYEAIATRKGLRQWWTTDVSGSMAEGGHLRFVFREADAWTLMRIDRARRPAAIGWTCAGRRHNGSEDHDEWMGTCVTFDLSERSPTTCELDFRHTGLTPQLASYEEAARAWDHFLASLVAAVERGAGTPYGFDRAKRPRGRPPKKR